MDTPTIPRGLRSREHIVVKEDDCATRWGNEGLLAFSTPALLGHMERICVRALQPYLSEQMMTVGGSVELQHLAPTPAGRAIEIRVELNEIAQNRLRFAFEAYDEHEKIGAGTHDRYLIDRARFLRRLDRKLNPSAT
jgi:predicted thioesterase